MGDSEEGLIDADERIQERLEELQQARQKSGRQAPQVDPQRVQQIESLRLARTALQQQLAATSHEARRKQLDQAIGELDRRITALA